MIDKQVAETKDLTTQTIHPPPTSVEERTPEATTPAPRSIRATAQNKTPAVPASVALPWLPGEAAGARKATVIRRHEQVGDAVAKDEPLLEVPSVRGDTVITSKVVAVLKEETDHWYCEGVPGFEHDPGLIIHDFHTDRDTELCVMPK